MFERTAPKISRLYTNPIHGDQQISVNVDHDGFTNTTFSHNPGDSTVEVFTYPNCNTTHLSVAEMTQLIDALRALRKRARRSTRGH